ncbi:MAG: hypothetical protein ACJA1T_001446 [Zhongshania aliphaticivorans]|jgi:hypothetical protein
MANYVTRKKFHPDLKTLKKARGLKKVIQFLLDAAPMAITYYGSK